MVEGKGDPLVGKARFRMALSALRRVDGHADRKYPTVRSAASKPGFYFVKPCVFLMRTPREHQRRAGFDIRAAFLGALARGWRCFVGFGALPLASKERAFLCFRALRGNCLSAGTIVHEQRLSSSDLISLYRRVRPSRSSRTLLHFKATCVLWWETSALCVLGAQQ